MADLYSCAPPAGRSLLAKQPNIDVLLCHLPPVVANPAEHAEQINAFLGSTPRDVDAMAASSPDA